MQLTIEQVDDLCVGAAFLGAGGGGDPYIGGLIVKQALDRGLTVDIIDAEQLNDDDLVIPTAMMGAPTVLLEKVPSGEEAVLALRKLEAHMGRDATATMPTEVGGINSTIPLFVAAVRGLPVVDADGMGRALPELQMETFAVHGVSGTPMAIANEHGDFAIVEAHSNAQMEWIARGITIRYGGTAYIADYPMSGAQVKVASVRNTLSLATDIGRIIRRSRGQRQDPFEALLDFLPTTDYAPARSVFQGKIVDVSRTTERGFTVGTVTIEGIAPSLGRCTIEFQNENLVARCDGQTLAIVPDIIAILDTETALPITNETLRYGQRVRVLAVGVPAIMTSPDALKLFGPEAFGLQEAFVPLGARQCPEQAVSR